MPLTKVSFSVIQVANNVTSTTVGNTTSIPSITFDQNGVITAVSNNAISIPASPQYVDSQSTHVFYYNAQNVTSNVTVSANQNSFAAGPITIDAPYSVTLNAGSTLVIL